MNADSHLITCRQFNNMEQVNRLFTLAEDLILKGTEATLTSVCRDRIMATLFYEPSLRTRFSFEAAMLRLGGQVISSEAAGQFSSHVKGESLEDTIRVVAMSYADVIVLRHPQAGAAKRASLVAGEIPVINAGDGDNEHPTQALLDLFTIRREIGRLDSLKVALVGDLKSSRTIHSLLYLLSLCPDVELILCAPIMLALPNGHRVGLRNAGIRFTEVQSLNEAVDCAPDVIYMTRLQQERYTEQAGYQAISEASVGWDLYRLDETHMARLANNAAILHPLPRNGEIPVSLDTDPRAAYFRQTVYGTVIRMAILTSLFGRKDLLEKSRPLHPTKSTLAADEQTEATRETNGAP